MRKNAFLTFCFSFGPGCGQMYQGYMRRGISLLGWFAVLFFLAVTLDIGALSIFMVVLWAFSFFDSFNIRALTNEQRTLFADDFLPNTAWFQTRTGARFKGKGGKILGWACVVLGVVSLYNNFAYSILARLAERFPFIDVFLYRLPSLLFSCAIVALGVWMLLRAKKAAQPTEEIVPFGQKEDNAHV